MDSGRVSSVFHVWLPTHFLVLALASTPKASILDECISSLDQSISRLKGGGDDLHRLSGAQGLQVDEVVGMGGHAAAMMGLAKEGS